MVYKVFIMKVLGLLLMTLIVGLILSYPVMLLWNYCLVPAVTILKTISWLQAWGIMVLCSVFFKSTVSYKE